MASPRRRKLTRNTGAPLRGRSPKAKAGSKRGRSQGRSQGHSRGLSLFDDAPAEKLRRIAGQREARDARALARAERRQAEQMETRDAKTRATRDGALSAWANSLPRNITKPRVDKRIVKEAQGGIAKIVDFIAHPAVADIEIFKRLAQPQVVEFLNTVPREFSTTFHLDVEMQKEGAVHEKNLSGGGAAPFVFSEVRSIGGGGKLFRHSFSSGSKATQTWEAVRASSNIEAIYDKLFAQIQTRFDEYTERGSGWTLVSVSNLRVRTHKTQAFSRLGSSFMALPKSLKDKKACINVENSDNKCFEWALKSALFSETKHAERTASYANTPSFVFEKDGEQIGFPFDVRDAEQFEQWNDQPINIFSIDVSDADKTADEYLDTIEHEYQFKRPSLKKVVSLLRVYDDVGNSHYVWIKNLNRLMRRSTDTHTIEHCEKCACRFSTQNSLENHQKKNRCHAVDDFAVEKMLPSGGSHSVQFKPTKPRVPFYAFLDCEALLQKVDIRKGAGTVAENQHVVTHIGVLFVSEHPELLSSTYKVFSDPTAVVTCLQWLEQKALECCAVLKRNVPINMTAEDEAAFQAAKECYMCAQLLNDDKVRDHNHVNGKYRGAAHNVCNLSHTFFSRGGAKKTSEQQKQKPPKVKFDLPVLVHNLKGYDSHLIMQFAGAAGLQMKDPIAQTLEKYLTFNVGHTKWLDTCQFLSAPLATLVDSLKKGGADKFKRFNAGFRNLSPELRELLLQKGEFPYEWYDSVSKLRAEHLPPREDFYSKLADSECETEDYARAQRVFELHCNDFEDYLMLYLKQDVLLLADVFENFREMWMEKYSLDALHYITLPGLSWASMLRKLRAGKASKTIEAEEQSGRGLREVQLMPDSIECFHEGQLSMLEFIAGSDSEKTAIKGGVSVITHRFAEANNPYLGTPEQFNAYKEDRANGLPCLTVEEAFGKYGWNPSDPASYIMYWDANNLYGWAMSQPLPVGEYAWILNNGERVHADVDGYGSEVFLTAHFNADFLKSLKADADKGFFLEVDLTYPTDLHNKHNELPFAPENTCFAPSETTAWQQRVIGTKADTTEKLIPNLYDKTKYKVHYRALQQMLVHGLVLTKVHRVLEFRQYPILKSYIDFNTASRAKATSDFEKDLYKLANNAIYGKTNENVAKHITVKFAQGPQRALHYASKPGRVKGFRIFSNNLTAYELTQTAISFTTPCILGAAILDISKTLVYDFHYGYVLPKYGNKAQLLFTDTDSLCYHITTEDIYADMLQHKEKFDMAGYHPGFAALNGGEQLQHSENKKVIGKMKDEHAEACQNIECKRCRGSTPLPHVIRAFCGLRAKMYACELVDEKTKMTAKGVKRSFVKNKLRFENYRQALFANTKADMQQHATFSAIRSFDHQLATVEITKTSLCPVDNKRYVLPDNVRTLAHGHFKIAASQ